jgi:hypothetical protein
MCPCKSQRFNRPLPLVFPAFWHFYCTPSSSLFLAGPAPTSAGMMRGSPGPIAPWAPSRSYGATGCSGSQRLTLLAHLRPLPVFSIFSCPSLPTVHIRPVEDESVRFRAFSVHKPGHSVEKILPFKNTPREGRHQGSMITCMRRIPAFCFNQLTCPLFPRAQMTDVGRLLTPEPRCMAYAHAFRRDGPCKCPRALPYPVRTGKRG